MGGNKLRRGPKRSVRAHTYGRDADTFRNAAKAAGVATLRRRSSAALAPTIAALVLVVVTALAPWAPAREARAEEALAEVVARPAEGPVAFSFKLPFGGRYRPAVLDGSPDQPGLVAKYRGPNGAVLVVGPAPERDFVKKTREGALRARQKALKYLLTDQQDDLECLVKIIEDNGSMFIIHRWFRVLRDPVDDGRAFLMVLEIPEDKLQEEGKALEAILATFRLGAA